eukprot:5126980-Alexandrium_andersonii.AAC.1
MCIRDRRLDDQVRGQMHAGPVAPASWVAPEVAAAVRKAAGEVPRGQRREGDLHQGNGHGLLGYGQGPGGRLADPAGALDGPGLCQGHLRAPRVLLLPTAR